jgi:hypothetical protein
MDAALVKCRPVRDFGEPSWNKGMIGMLGMLNEPLITQTYEKTKSVIKFSSFQVFKFRAEEVAT